MPRQASPALNVPSRSVATKFTASPSLTMIELGGENQPMKKLLPLFALYCIAFLVLACAPQVAPTPIPPAPTSAPSQGDVPTPPNPPAQPSPVFGGQLVRAKLGDE